MNFKTIWLLPIEEPVLWIGGGGGIVSINLTNCCGIF